MPKYKATAYIRLSYTDDHSSESDSVSNQRKLIATKIGSEVVYLDKQVFNAS